MVKNKLLFYESPLKDNFINLYIFYQNNTKLTIVIKIKSNDFIHIWYGN